MAAARPAPATSPWEYAAGPQTAARAWQSGLRGISLRSPRGAKSRARSGPASPRQREAVEAAELLRALFPDGAEAAPGLLEKRPIEWLLWKLVWAEEDEGSVFAQKLLDQFVANRPENRELVKTLLIHHMREPRVKERCHRLLEAVVKPRSGPAPPPRDDAFMFVKPAKVIVADTAPRPPYVGETVGGLPPSVEQVVEEQR